MENTSAIFEIKINHFNKLNSANNNSLKRQIKRLLVIC